MPVLSHFSINSDYAAIKEKQSFSITLDVPRVDVQPRGGSYDRYIDMTVPDGIYIEHVNIRWSWTGDNYPSHYIVYNDFFKEGQLAYYIALYKINKNTYRLRFYARNTDKNPHNTPDSNVITASVHLFSSSL